MDVTIGEFINDTQYLDEEAHPKNQHQPAVMLFNTSKHNKNLISFTGVLILSFIFITQTILPLGSRLGWITQKNASLYLYIHLCCTPIIFPTIYFIRKPKYLISVLKDLQSR